MYKGQRTTCEFLPFYYVGPSNQVIRLGSRLLHPLNHPCLLMVGMEPRPLRVLGRCSSLTCIPVLEHRSPPGLVFPRTRSHLVSCHSVHRERRGKKTAMAVIVIGGRTEARNWAGQHFARA